jgi:hypothetical protein
MYSKCSSSSGLSSLRCFEQPGERSAIAGSGLSAGDRTQSLRRRILYDTTAAQIRTATKFYNGQDVPNEANGDLRFKATNAGRTSGCLQFSYSHAAHLDANLGSVLSKGRCATVAQVRALHEKRHVTLKRGGLHETGTAIASYTANNQFQVDLSYNAGKYNRIVYVPHDRLNSGSASYPGLSVDPSGTVVREYLQSTVIDVCGSAFTTDMSLVKVSTTDLPPLLRATQTQAIVDVCFGFPLRTRF